MKQVLFLGVFAFSSFSFAAEDFLRCQGVWNARYAMSSALLTISKPQEMNQLHVVSVAIENSLTLTGTASYARGVYSFNISSLDGVNVGGVLKEKSVIRNDAKVGLVMKSHDDLFDGLFTCEKAQ